MDKIKQNRALSFVIIAVVYAIAIVGGIFIYRALLSHMDFWLALLVADICATVITYIFSVIFNNASVYDPYWSVQPIVILTAFACIRPMGVVQWLLLVAVWFWGVRLTANWAYCFGNLCHQDWRYTHYKEKTGKAYQLANFFGIHLIPTLIVYGCVLPAVFAFEYATEITANAGSYVFFIVSIGAAVMQMIADIQMQRYRKSKKGGLIRVGLWKYSRHPNYLGEILMWWGVGFAVLCVMPERWWLLAGALANTLMFLFISIPLAEGRQSQKPTWAEYKSETRMLLPIPRFTRKKAEDVAGVVKETEETENN